MGGELFDMVIERKHFTEVSTAAPQHHSTTGGWGSGSPSVAASWHLDIWSSLVPPVPAPGVQHAVAAR